MPIARFKGVFLCSSEDKNHPATNLVNNSGKKWKCEETGLDSVYAILQLENPIKLNGIDIGNENSAFIDVSVGRSGWPLDKYKTILVASSFMTITESRVSENPNRVRCFGKSALMPDVAEETWELVKVTCTQGFNKQIQFGLSFIKIYTADTVPASGSASPSVKPIVSASPKEKKSCDEALGLPQNSVFAQFRMRNDSSESDKESETASSLFSKWKKEKDSPKKESNAHNPLSAAAAIREASSSMSKYEQSTRINHKIATPSGKTKRPIKSDEKDSTEERLARYRPALLYDDDDENTSNPKLEELINQDNERIERERKQLIDKKKVKKDIPREEKCKQKMEASADKFKVFLNKDEPSLNQSQTSIANLQSDDDDNVEVKTQSPQASSASPMASKALLPDEETPAWKVKKKRPSPSNEGSASKRSRKSMSPEPTSQNSNTDSDTDTDIDKILRGVVFVISGITNPERGNMRDKGLKMGAKYKPDWNDSCTHLICAFKNTPKFNQVQGSGIIVNRNWIEDCFAQKKKLPWQDYQL